MVYFFDSSALVKRYVQETGFCLVKQLTTPTTGNYVYIADITGIEVLAALARQGRSGTLTPVHRTFALTTFRLDFAGLFYRVEISTGIIDEAMHLAELHFLRGYDAVQLAVALVVNRGRQARGQAPLTFISADGELNRAAAAEGLLVDDPNAYP